MITVEEFLDRVTASINTKKNYIENTKRNLVDYQSMFNILNRRVNMITLTYEFRTKLNEITELSNKINKNDNHKIDDDILPTF